MGKYIVTKPLLNVRNAPKLTDSTYAGSLGLGEELELADQTVTGDTPIGTTDNTWRTDNMNRFVSNAAVAPLGSYAAKRAEFLADQVNIGYYSTPPKDDDSNWRISWGHIDMDIYKVWKAFGTKGEGIKVVVIDNGAWSDQNDLKGRLSADSQNIADASPIDGDDPEHGTFCAGLIAANGANCNTVYGVAPGCELIVLKAGGGTNGILTTDIIKSIQKARDLNANIISISQSLDSSDPTLALWIADCQKRNILVFCSAGNLGSTAYSFPASNDGAYSVGAYQLDAAGQRQLQPNTNRNDKVSFLAPGMRLLTTSQNKFPSFFNDTSASTAFAAGMFALILGALKKPINKTELDKALAVAGNCQQIPPGSIPFDGCRIPDLLQLITSLKK